MDRPIYCCQGRRQDNHSPNLDNNYQKKFNVQQLKPFHRNWQDTRMERYQHDILITEIIKPGDPKSEKFDNTKLKEIQGLIDRGCSATECATAHRTRIGGSCEEVRRFYAPD
jgi:hypothetical protein